MNTKKILGGATCVATAVSLCLAPAAMAGTRPKISVRVEGKAKTLLRAKLVTPNGKKVKRGGHSCAGNTLLDPFNLATHGRWSGPWYSGLGFEPTRVLGETDSYGKTGSWYELFINNRAASEGLCSLKIRRGEHVLLAAVPDSGTEYPTAVEGPSQVRSGVKFTVTVVQYNAQGKKHALKGATVTGGGLKATTNAKGRATLTAKKSGKLVLTATKKSEIRSEIVVKVTA